MAVVSNENIGAGEVDLNSLWIKSTEILRGRLDPQIFTAWIKPLSLSKSIDAQGQLRNREFGSFELVAPNKFCRDHITKHYTDIISSALSDVIGSNDVKVSVKSLDLENKPRVSSTPVRPAIEKRQVVRATKTEKQLCVECNLNPNYNFSNFVVGSCNQFAHAVSLKVSEQPGAIYNPLFVYGGVGLGKTHLVNAIGNSARRRGKKVLLVTSEYFVNELIHSVRNNKMPEFKSKFRTLDVLIIDDIQFIIGKERTQEEFFHTFNDLHQKHKQIVITADKLPQEMVGIEERLKSRFSSGLSVDLQTPDFETRVAILSKKAELSGIELTNNVAQFLADRIDTNVRELEGALNRIQEISAQSSSPITLELAESALRMFAKQDRKTFTTDQIQQAVAAFYRVSANDLLGKRRTTNIASARHIAMYLCRILTNKSYPEIGALFGGRDHSTVIHACKTVEDRIKEEPNIKGDLDTIKSKVL
ncbi:MAG: chromosomal replication initiator protein DnaA [Deltaproteobacteria bacterium]|nr:chromosomal replication initiator protein DnaA [Deltaproteobacteria bacterium]